MNKSSLIQKVINKKNILVKLFLSFKYFSPNSFYFYLIVILIKLLGLLIVTSDFLIDYSNKYSYYFSEILRCATCFGIFIKSINYSMYLTISIIIFILIAIATYLLYLVNKLSKGDEHFLINNNGVVLSKILKVTFVILLVASNYIIEFCSIAFLIQFKSDTSAIIHKYENLKIFSIAEKNINIVALILNTITIIIMNIFFYTSYKILNEPFFNSNFPVKFRYTNYQVFLMMFISNLQMIHYIEIFIISETGRIFYKSVLIALIYILIIIAFIKSLSIFNFRTTITILINLALSYAIFSSSIEIILVSTKNRADSVRNSFFILACKIILSISWMVIYYIFTKQIFLTKSNLCLFKSYDGKVTDSEVECMYGLVETIINIQNDDVTSLQEIIDIILNHRLLCAYDFCKCNLITSFQKENLNEDLFYILEMIFTKFNIGQDKHSILLFAEYLCSLKNMNLFSYALINTFINKNMKKLTNLQLVELYTINLNLILIYDYNLRGIKEYTKFTKIYKSIKLIKSYDKIFLQFTDNIETLVNFKDKLDNTYKFNNDHSKLNSYVFDDMNEIIVACNKFKEQYKSLKQKIKKDFSKSKCKSIELSYKIHEFFMLFNKKVPEKIKHLITADSDHSALHKKNLKKYFEKELNKFISSNNNSAFNIIIEINNIFKINYISSKLCDVLGYEHAKLLGDDLHTIFPKEFKELHKKVLLNFFLIRKQMYFEKTTFAFTSTNETLPVELKVATFPNLEKNLQAIVSLKFPQRSDERIYQFIMSHEFEVFAVSKNFEQDYCLNYDSIEKSKINILKIFDLNEIIHKKFITTLNKLAEIKYEKQLESLYCMSNFLFNMKNNDDAIQFGILGLMNSNKNDDDKRVEKKLMKKNMKNNQSNNNFLNESTVNPLNENTKSMDINRLNKLPKIDIQIVEYKENSANNKEKNQDMTNTFLNINNSIAQEGLNSLMHDATQSDKKLKFNNNLSSRATFANFKSTTLQNKGADMDDGTMLQQSKKSRNKASSSIKTDQANPELTVIGKSLNFNLKETTTNMVNPTKYDKNNLELSNQSENCRQFFTVIGKHEVINNFEKIKNRCYDMHLDEVYYEKIIECIKRLKENIGAVKIAGTQQKGIYSKSFDIKAELRVMNDVPFFVIKIRDNFQTLPTGDHKIIQIERTPLKNKSNTNNENIRVSNKRHNSIKEKTKPLQDQPTSDFTNRQPNSEIKNLKAHDSSTSEMVKLPLNNSNTNKNRINNSSKNLTSSLKADLNQKQNKIGFTIFLFMIISLILASITFYFKEYSLKVSYSLFSASYYNSLQYSSILFLHSSLITLTLNLAELTKLEYTGYTLTNQDILELIALRSYQHRENYKTFYDKILYNNFNSKLILMNFLNKPVDFNETMLTWENRIKSSSINEESDFIVSNSKLLSLEKDLTMLHKDIKEYLLFDSYITKRTQLQNSQHSRVIYFANLNVPYIFSDVIEEINDFNLQDIHNFNNSWRLYILITQIIEVLISILLVIIIFNVLETNDRRLFQIILKMFINSEKDRKAPFKSPNEIQIIRIRMKNFKVLLKVFNKYNILAYENSLKNPLKIIYSRNEEGNLMINQINSNDMDYANNLDDYINKSNTDDANHIYDSSKSLHDNLNSGHKKVSNNESASTNLRNQPRNWVSGLIMSNQFANKMLARSNQNSGLRSPNVKFNLDASINSQNGNQSILNADTSKEFISLNSSANNFKNLLHKGSVISSEIPFRQKSKNFNSINKKKNKLNNVISNPVSMKIITISKVLKKTEHHQLFIIKLAKILITSIFLVYIILLITNLAINNIYFDKIQVTTGISDTILSKIPTIIKIFNLIRLDVISNNKNQLIKNYEKNSEKYLKINQDFIDKMNKYYKVLPTTNKFSEILNLPLDNENQISIANEICENNKFCEEFMSLKNGINSKGVNLAFQTVMQTISDTYKDYVSSDPNSFNENFVKKLFLNRDFFNINLQSEYVFDKVNYLFSTKLKEDIESIYKDMEFINHILGIMKIMFCVLIFCYVLFAFNAQLKKYQSFIAYSAEKINRALFDKMNHH